MPSTQRVHIDKALTNVSIGYKNEEYIADKVFPSVVVGKQSDKYYTYGMEAFRANDDARSPGALANEIKWTLSNDSYYCDGHALKTMITDEELDNADNEFELNSDATELVSEGIALNKEVDAANRILDKDSYADKLKVTLGGAGDPKKWSEPDSNPILDIQKAREMIHQASGLVPNTLVLSRPVYNVLRLHPALKSIISHAKDQFVSMEIMKMAFDVENILIGSALKSTTPNVGQNIPGMPESLNYIWGNAAVLAYIPARPKKRTPSLGYTFEWERNGTSATQVRKWYEIPRKATLIEAERWYDQKIVSNVAGFLFADAVDPMGSFE